MNTNHICKLFLINMLFLLGVSYPASAAPPSGSWMLIWSDEFDSGSMPEYPNSANWDYESGYVRNEEWQYYTSELQNAYCQDGFLHIEAHQHPAGTYPTGSYSGQDGSISSASLVSWGKVTNKYGWLEMRGRIDTQGGSWPAFWTLGVNGQWPDNGECDIMEWYQDYLHFNVAWWKTGDPAWTARWDSVTSYAPTLNDFHTWAMQWTPQEVRLYMDGALYNTWDSSLDDNGDGDTSIEGFQQPHYIILNQAIGGTAGGNASGVVYPTNYEVDYVRWYQDMTEYIDDGDASITYSGTWGTWSGNPGYMETEHYSETAGSEATFTFTGDQVWYYGFKRNDLGYADILLDGQSAASVDCYSSASEYFTSLYESPQLTYDTHTLTVRVSGIQNPASSGTEVIVDAFGYSGAPAAPANLEAFPGDGNISLNWQDNDEADLAGYNVYRSTVSGGSYSQITAGLTSSDYVDNTVTNGTTYYYVVSAVDTSSYESAVSNEASATPALLLSQGQPVTASSYESGNEPLDGNDGNLSSRWTASSSNYPEWWRVDLGSVKSLSLAVIYWYGGTARSYKYQIEISDDDVNYTTLVDQTSRTETGTSTDIFSASARYVRVTVTGINPAGGWASFWECGIFGSTPDTTPPASPAGLAATAGDSSVSLDWTDNTEPDLASYSVYRSTTSGSGYASIATDVATSDYVDDTAANGTTYYYVVTAVDTSSNESGYSNEDSATPIDTPPAAPTGLIATAGDAIVSLNWNDNSEPDLMYYNIYRSTTSGSGYVSIYSGAVTSDYVDNSVTNGTTYYYVVTAVDVSSYESGYSNEASATPDVVSDIIDTASVDIAVSGNVGGSYTDTQAANNVYESISETESGGKPQNRYTYLEHKWIVNVTGGDTVSFYVQAYHTANTENDDFVFAYSTDDSTYTNMLTVTKTSDDDTYQSCSLPASLSGTVYIRVLDTDQTSGNRNPDTVYVDHLYILSTGGEPDTTPPSPDPMTWTTVPYSTGSTSIAMAATTASDPSGVEYYFTCNAGGGHDSGWQSSPLYEDTGLSPETSYTYTVKARDLSSNLNETSVSTAESATTDPAGSEPDMYVDDIAMGYRNAGPNYFGRATIWIKDDTGANIEGATVYGTWSGATSESVNGTTLIDGTVLLESSKVRNGGTFTFTVTDVVKTGYVYNSVLNVETSDSITAP